MFSYSAKRIHAFLLGGEQSTARSLRRVRSSARVAHRIHGERSVFGPPTCCSETVLPDPGCSVIPGTLCTRNARLGFCAEPTTGIFLERRAGDSTEPFQDPIADAQCVGHDCQRWVHCCARREKATVHDVQVAHIVSTTIPIEHG